MAATTLTAALYFLFAICLITFTLLLRVDLSSSMYAASVYRFVSMPWALTPTRTMYDVQGPSEVYQWLTDVFIKQLFLEYPVNGEDDTYCSEEYPCTLDEGVANRDSDCAQHLLKGDRNCAGYMPSSSACCEPCRDTPGSPCPQISIKTATVTNLTSTTSVEDLSENCNELMPSWLSDLSQWIPENLSAPLPEPSELEFKFCPERVAKKSYDINTRQSSPSRPLTIGQYNHVLMGRFSLKRFKYVESTSVNFKVAYPKVRSSAMMDATGWNWLTENRSMFGDAPAPEFVYHEGKGYYGAGGYIAYTNFMNGQNEYAVLNHLNYLYENNWFDLYQGSFVVELLLFNGNIEKFMHVSFVFQHGFAGQTAVYHNTNTLDLSYHDPHDAVTYLRCILYVIILTLFVYFFKNEVDDMSADYQTYFRNFMSVVQLVSLASCAFCIACYASIVLDYDYLYFRFPFPDGEKGQIESFEALVKLSDRMQIFMSIMSANILLIFIRLISLLTNIVPEAGIVFNTIHSVRQHLLGFFTMFLLMVAGFAFSGYYLFGTRMYEFSSVESAFVTTTKAMLGESLFDEMVKADPMLGFTFYIVFHLFFLIVKQPLLSIIIQGYAKEQARMKTLSGSDRFPLERYWLQLKIFCRDSSTWLNRCFAGLQGMLFGSADGGSTRINYEQIAKLRDGRATRPRFRNVVYDKKAEDYGGDSHEPSEDLVLTAREPFYTNGMMQYYVADVTPEGPAYEAKVQKDFRLVGIEIHGCKDRDCFRDSDKFHSRGAYKSLGYQSDTKNILTELKESLPVTLEFEGRIKPVSKECVALICFIFVFFFWAIWVLRGPASSSLTDAHVANIESPMWYEYNPSRLASYSTVDGLPMVANWMDHALRGQYACVSGLSDLGACEAGGLTEKTRPNWFLYTGVGSTVGQTTRASGLPLQKVPEAATGMSVGFVPFTSPARSAPSMVEMTDVVRDRNYNVGIMANNHVRLTLQTACFQKNPATRYKNQYPFIIHPVIQASWGCSHDACMKKIREREDSCHASDGSPRNLDSFRGQASGITYTYAEEGTFGDAGGIAIGMGKTQEELSLVLSILANDRLIVSDVVSLVFESVTYNGNLDLFTYTAVMFNVDATGYLTKEIFSSVFPLNIFSRGQMPLALRTFQQTTIFTLFGIYMFWVVVFTIYLLYDLSVQYQITKALQRAAYQFIPDFFMEDWWNFVDVLSTICNIYVLVALMKFALIDVEFQAFSSEVISSWTLDYEVRLEVGLTDADPMTQFYSAARHYNDFCGALGLNGLLMAIRLIKYFGAVPQLRLMMTTLSAAFYEISVITGIFFLMWVGFAVMFYTRFAIQFGNRHGHPFTTLTELFLYLCGRFITHDMQQNSPVYFIPVFIGFNVIFLLLTSMYLAALVYRWRDSRRDAQDFSLRVAAAKVYETLYPASRTRNEYKTDTNHLGKDFWCNCSVLSYLHYMDEFGRISLTDSQLRSLKNIGDLATDAEHNDDTAIVPVGYHDGGGEGETGGMGLGKPCGAKEFLAIFQRAHMEIASQLCHMLPPSGAGANELRGEGRLALCDADLCEGQAIVQLGARAATKQGGGSTVTRISDVQENDDGPPAIGIVEQPVDKSVELFVECKLVKLMQEQEHLAWEVWLDSLITVLESIGTLKRIQEFFLPMPMLHPRKTQEWGKYNEKKVKMECRLNLFLKWLTEETNIRHNQFLKDSAAAKGRLLKQQSLVLTDYLEHVDERIRNLAGDIKVLEQRTLAMRAHVSPLL